MAEPISQAAEEFGARVRAHRQELGLSQERPADACGLHWTFVGQVERGQRNLALHNILKLAHGLRIDPGELVKGLRAPNGKAAARTEVTRPKSRMERATAWDLPGWMGVESGSRPRG